MIEHFIILFGAHCIGDYPLQGEFLAKIKGSNSFLLFIHSFIWAFCIFMAFKYIGITLGWLAFYNLVLFHWFIDQMKCSFGVLYPKYALTRFLWVDQFLHVVQIYVTYFVYIQ